MLSVNKYHHLEALVQLPDAGSPLKNVNRQLDGSRNMIPVDLTWTIVDSFSLLMAYRFHLFWLSRRFLQVQSESGLSLNVIIFIISAKKSKHLQLSNSDLLFTPTINTNIGSMYVSFGGQTLWNSAPDYT